jgi:hypothetical protein
VGEGGDKEGEDRRVGGNMDVIDVVIFFMMPCIKSNNVGFCNCA